MEIFLKRAGPFPSLLPSIRGLPFEHKILGCHFYSYDVRRRNVNSLAKINKHDLRIHESPLVSRISRKINHFPTTTVVEKKSLFSDSAKEEKEEKKEEKELTRFQKLKQLFKDYWYIVIPVHIATSLVWVAIFYTACKTGVDFAKIMEYFNYSGQYVDKVKNSSIGQWALIYLLYKIFTPLRYTATLGSTTMTMRYLNKWGYLKYKDSKQILSNAVKKMRDGSKSKD